MTTCLVLLFLLALKLTQTILGERCSRYARAGYFTATRERFLAGHELSQTAAVSSATRCSVMCFTEPRCSAFTYWHSEQICVLHGATKEDLFGNLSTNASASYYQYKTPSALSSSEAEIAKNLSVNKAPSDFQICSEYALDAGDADYNVIDEILLVNNFTLDFSVKMEEGAVLELCQQDAQEDNDPVPVYAIDIGVSGNNQSRIRQVGNDSIVAIASTPGILSAAEFRQFWVTYQNGLVLFGRAAERQTALLEHDGRATVPAGPGVRRAAVTSAYPVIGEWRVLGDACLESD